MELRELRSLLTLAEVGSITKTADKLNLSPAAIHRQLKVLEEELGIQLYEKVGQQLRLTRATETLLPHIRNLFAQYEATHLAVNDLKGMKRGMVRIGTGPTFSSYVLPALLEEYRKQFPEVELFVETGNTGQLIESLNNGYFDLAFPVSSALSESSNLVVQARWDFAIVLVSGPQHRPSVSREVKLAELREIPFILYKEGSIFENLIDQYFVTNDFYPRVTMRFDNAESIKAMIRAGLGISMLPMWTLGEELKNKTLLLVRQQEHPLTAKIDLITRKLSYLPGPVEAFMRIAKKWRWKNARLLNS